jgi:hypothetical protein
MSESEELTELAELLERELAMLDELLQLGGPYFAQYSGLQVSQGQSGQLLPCGQYKPLEKLLLEERNELELLEELRLLEANDEGMLLEGIELLVKLTTLLLAGLLDITLLQTAPVTAGRCAGLLATPLFPCTPNSTV